MKKKLMLLALSIVMSTGLLTACAMDDDNQMNNQPEDVNYDPMRYGDNQNRMNYDRMDDRMDNGRMDENRMNENRGPDMGADPRDVREPGERDTPFNMDEEEPDVDEEPSEERRDQ
ncbi:MULTISPECIES: hypothetical protein [Halobacillus]|uniref:Lipoprotein n=1 Tax=Halobacillus halophilus (strain ATCC 35676 / DSM 2266 / JCM 20832 / KCTC 3685 / LMG 17431 / NBRC 102448 / NCIMB 2269) TaxID=866895 RepID=I0JMF6_HALH3|nr:hypothetical protein [Halobacillus halophilus]ASF39408.1 hypothetical protein CEH05_09835 [Halobacillus halophilus]CCG45326.1 hypothetical protein HBHAL_2979 [Halobacillus halophilus DSM 2266]